MKLTKIQLERKIQELNEWLLENKKSNLYKLRERDRNYYVSKLIELEELGINN